MHVGESKEFYLKARARGDHSLGKAFVATGAQGLRFQSPAPCKC